MHYDGEIYECHCGQAYKSMQALKRHKETHEEKVTCEVCRQHFSNRDRLKCHWNKKHSQIYGKFETIKRRSQ